ncbi:MAG: PIN domain-containing protein, partial [Synergistaceae bacterium]|nr:PIN domain-containing protein [Synergistaceae bacterium]
MKKYIYIDFENLPGVEMEHIDDAKILIFLGENQKKIPTEMIRKTQPMGDRVEWVTISGVGRNALDFHIAYYLAKNHTDPSANHYIVSMDAGYDPLIKHVALFGQKVKRIITL